MVAAGLYNLVWGAFVVLFPGAIFRWAGAAAPNYPQLWQCVGMIVGVYGVGYLVASRDPLRHWPIVLVGLLGKVLGPIGFVHAVLTTDFPPAFGWTIVTNDLVWWAPFGLIVYAAFRRYGTGGLPETPERPFATLGEALEGTTITGGPRAGASLASISDEAPTLVVFFRHSGCTFCREAAADLASARASIEGSGRRIAVVMMAPGDDHARGFLARYGLDDLPRILDPERRLYHAFGLRRGTFWQLLGPRVVWRGVVAGLIKGHGVGPLTGDGFQMPGTFVVHRGRVIASHPHRSASDRQDYASIACAAV